jgi:hypothetical protein
MYMSFISHKEVELVGEVVASASDKSEDLKAAGGISGKK